VVTPETCRAVIRLNKKTLTCASSWNYIPGCHLVYALHVHLLPEASR
jgi:hypothetical protein